MINLTQYNTNKYNELVSEIENIKFAEIKLENECEERVCSNLNLWDGRNTQFGYADVSWHSDKPEVVSTSGKVICQKEKSRAVITAEFSYQSYPEISLKKSFCLSILSGDGISSQESTPMFIRDNKKVLFVIGDSTASCYPHEGENNRFPQTGWAQYFGKHFDDDKMIVADIAMSGRSAKSYMSEDNFKLFKERITEGDFIILQFGHNDSKIEDPSRYSSANDKVDTKGSYKNYMNTYIEIAKMAGAIPILATSFSRRKLSDQGLEEYVNATIELGAELGIPVLDVYKRSSDWINEVGLEKAKEIYKIIKPHDERFMYNPEFRNSQYYDSGDKDDTHLNIFGADIVAGWVIEEITEKVPCLGKLLI